VPIPVVPELLPVLEPDPVLPDPPLLPRPLEVEPELWLLGVDDPEVP
jgi:hypothetical protein